MLRLDRAAIAPAASDGQHAGRLAGLDVAQIIADVPAMLRRQLQPAGGLQRNQRAPAVADQRGAFNAQGIEQRRHKRSALLNAGRRIAAAAAMAGQIDGQHVPAVVGHVAALQGPHAVVVEHAVDEHHRGLGGIEGLAAGVAVDGGAVDLDVHGQAPAFSAALSVVFGLHHCVANCIVLNALGEFYPDAFVEFRKMIELQQVALPQGVCANLTDELRSALIAATIKHEKPLTNALGADFRKTLTDSRIISLFEKM